MILSDLLKKVEKRPTRKRRGRGPGSGLGKTSGRGHKGAAARSGFKRRLWYEGGQVPILRRMPKRGFTNARFRVRYDVVNVADLEAHFSKDDEVTLQALEARGVVKPRYGRLKVLGGGELTKKLAVVAHAVSQSARQKIEASGGSVQVLGQPKKKRRRGRGHQAKKASDQGGGGAPVANVGSEAAGGQTGRGSQEKRSGGTKTSGPSESKASKSTKSAGPGEKG